MSRVVLALAALLLHGASVACEPSGNPQLRLELTASPLAGGSASERTLTVELHDNHCAAVRRPAFWREPGTFAVPVAAEVGAAMTARAAGLLRSKTSSDSLRDEVERLRERPAKDGSIEVHEVSDPDLYRLWVWQGGTPRRIELEAALQWAAAFPQSRSLAAFDALRDGLQRIAIDGSAAPMSPGRGVLVELQR